MRGSALPAVATPSAMTTVSLGSTGMTASRAGMTIAMTYERTEPTCRLVSALTGAPALSPRAARLGVTAGAVPRLGDESQQAGRDRRLALLAPAVPAGRQPGESLLDVRQLPAGRYRPAQQQLGLALDGFVH